MEGCAELVLAAERAALVDDALELPLRPFRGLVRIDPFGQSLEDLGGKTGSLARSAVFHDLSVSLAENWLGVTSLPSKKTRPLALHDRMALLAEGEQVVERRETAFASGNDVMDVQRGRADGRPAAPARVPVTQ